MKTSHFFRILCVDDDDDTSELIRLMLQQANAGYRVTSAKTAEEGLALAEAEKFDLYVLDYKYPGLTGVDICHKIRATDPKTPILFFTGSATEAEKEEAMACGANAYLIKPDDLERLTDTAQRLLGAEGIPSAA